MKTDKDILSSIEAKLYAILDEIKEYKKNIKEEIDVTKFKCLKTLNVDSGRVCSVAYSPDGKYIISGLSDKNIKMWDANTGECLKTIKSGHTREVDILSYSPFGKYFISASSSTRPIKIWDVSTGKYIKILRGQNSLESVIYSPDGKYIVSSTGLGIQIWEASTGVCLKILKNRLGFISSIAFSPDGQRIIGSSYDNIIGMIDLKTGKSLQTLKGHSSLVNSLAYSPDGNYIVSGSDKFNLRSHSNKYPRWNSNCVIKIWDTNTGECLKNLEGHSNSVNSVAYSPDGTKIISGSDDKTIKIWNANTGECLQTLEGHSGSIYSIAYSPDGSRIISGSGDGTIKIWGEE